MNPLRALSTYFFIRLVLILPSNLRLGRSSKLLMVLASTVILGSESHGTHDDILLSHDSGGRAPLPPTPNVFLGVSCVTKGPLS
jgi:hypothetical protein